MIDQYLLSTDGIDWGTVLAGWAGLLPEALTVWFVNRFGDVILVLDDESVHLLDVGAGSFRRIAESREQFFELMDVDEKANDWFMIPLVDECIAAGVELAEGRCYCFKWPPIIGGNYKFANVGTITIQEHYSFLADLWNQLKDHPDGTQVRVVIT